MPKIIGSCFLLLMLPCTHAFAAESCDPDGAVQFICGPVNPEDLYQIPDTPWVIASGRISDEEGSIYAVNTLDHSVHVIFPEAALAPQHDRSTYADCPGPNNRFQPHGIAFRAGSDSTHILYVISHGDREAIEVFNLVVSGNVPTMQWTGCIMAPPLTARLNSVTALPDARIAATNYDTTGGQLWEWHPASGWSEVPGSEMRGPNGLVSSIDGQWLYIGGWSDQALVRLSRGKTPIQLDSVDVGFNVDNVRWTDDGRLLAAGQGRQCGADGRCTMVASRVASVNPETLAVQQLVDYPVNALIPVGTVAIEVGDEIWVGGIRGTERIGRFPRQ